MNKEEKEAINRLYDVTHQTNGKHVNYIDINNICVDEDELESCEGFCKAIDTVLNLIQKQEKIINYSIDRILPSPEEYLEIKKIMKENKWGYDHSKKEYFRKWVENVNNIK